MPLFFGFSDRSLFVFSDRSLFERSPIVRFLLGAVAVAAEEAEVAEEEEEAEAVAAAGSEVRAVSVVTEAVQGK